MQKIIFHMTFILCCCAASNAAQLTIMANPGTFASLQKAAAAETQVNWWDDDPEDDRACTESFAAMELAKFLPECAIYDPNAIVLSPVGELPEQGDVILLGSGQSNPLIKRMSAEAAVKLEHPESFRIRAYRQGQRVITLIEGKDRIGTLYGAYGYLEKLGMRFYGPGDRSNPRAGTTVSVTYMLRPRETSNPIREESYTIPSKGTVYPAARTALPQTLDLTETPAYLTRGFWAWEPRGDEDFFLWMARNRMNLWTAAEKNIHFLKKLGIKLTDGGHKIQYLFLNPQNDYPFNHARFEGDQDKPVDPYQVSPDYLGDANSDGRLSYFEAHPEWYGLRNGKRSPNIGHDSGDNYCTTNPDATRQLTRNLVQSLIDGQFHYVDVLNVWMLDNGKWCQCLECEKQGTFTDRQFVVCDAILREIAQARRQNRLHRNVEITACAYLETLAPPTRKLPMDFDYQNFSVTFFPIHRCYVHAMNDPQCTDINQHIVQDYHKWTIDPNRFYRGSLFIGEYYNLSYFKSLPLLFTASMAADIPFYYETGIRHFNYMHTPTRLWGTWTLNQYLLARLLWNPAADVSALQEEFFRLYYPTTFSETKTFYALLEQATLNIRAYNQYVSFGGTPPAPRVRPADHLKYDRHTPALNDGPDVVEIVESMRLARKSLDAALMQCEDDTERQRLLEDDLRFSYGEAMFSYIYYLTRTVMAHQSGRRDLAAREFEKVRQIAQTLRAVKEPVHVASSHANSEDGFEATRLQKAYEFFKNEYGAE